MNLCDVVRHAIDVRHARAEARDVRDAYDNTLAALRKVQAERDSLRATLQAALTRLAGHDGCAERVALAEEYAAQMEAERDDARREVDDVRAALVWLEDKWFKTGGVS